MLGAAQQRRLWVGLGALAVAGVGCRKQNPAWLGASGGGESTTGGLGMTASTSTPDDGDGLDTPDSSGGASAEDGSTDDPNPTGGVPSECPDDADLVGCYAFEDVATGAFVDGSSFGNDGTARAASATSGINGQGVAVDEASRLVVADDESLELTEAFTLAAWVRLDAFPDRGSMVTATILDHGGWYALESGADGDVECSVGNRKVSAGLLTLGQWAHVACTWDGAQLVLYRDGTSMTVGDAVDPMVPAAAADLTIGGNKGFGAPMTGALDEVRLWRRAVTPAEVCELSGSATC